MNDQNTALIISMLTKLAADNSFNKAFNLVLLNELSKVSETNFSDLKTKAKEIQKDNYELALETFQDLADDIYGDSRPKYVEDYLG